MNRIWKWQKEQVLSCKCCSPHSMPPLICSDPSCRNAFSWLRLHALHIPRLVNALARINNTQKSARALKPHHILWQERVRHFSLTATLEEPAPVSLDLPQEAPNLEKAGHSRSN
jgi:hypothetical protein